MSSGGERVEKVTDGMILVGARGFAILDAAEDQWFPEAFTDEKLYIVAVPEFQELEQYILIFLKALYGLKSSGKRWAEVILGILRDMKFLPSKADPCIWLRKAPSLRCYEYIAVYVDTLCIAAESPSAII